MTRLYSKEELLKKLLFKKSENRTICFVKELSCVYVKCSVPNGISLLNKEGHLDSKLYYKYRINNIEFREENGVYFIVTDGSNSSSTEYDMTKDTMREVETALERYVVYERH